MKVKIFKVGMPASGYERLNDATLICFVSVG